MNPDQLSVDTTSSTNKECRPLIIIGGIDSNRRNFSGGHALVPNESKWAFLFFFKFALGFLYGDDVIKRIQQISTDGDSHIFKPLESLVRDESQPWNCFHVGCLFHLVRMQLNAMPTYSKEGKTILDKIKQWIFTWIDYCETHAEFSYSYQLFLQWINSQPIKSRLGNTYTQVMDNYLTTTF